MDPRTAYGPAQEHAILFEFPSVHEHKRILRVLSVLSTLLTIALLYLASQLPLFDSSPRAVLHDNSFMGFIASPILRWDAFHFAHVAQEGYMYEHEWAFMPGAPLVMKTASRLLQAVNIFPSDVPLHAKNLLVGGALISCLCGTTSTLYDLTVYHFRSSNLAFLASLLSLIPSSPATLRLSVYNEPFFTYFSYKGMWYCSRSKFFLATLCFGAACAFRSNGVASCVYLVWSLVGESLLTGRKFSVASFIKAISLSITVLLPLVYHQYGAYSQFCTGRLAITAPPWCAAALPAIYSYVQGRYWDVGFLRYWTPSQFPNILLAVPPLTCILSFSITHLWTTFRPLLLVSLRKPYQRRPITDSRGLMPLSVTPYAVHSLALALILLFAAHTQIALRLVAALPLTYWAAAWLLVEYPRLGKWWIAWSVVWGAISTVLWAVFLPPA